MTKKWLKANSDPVFGFPSLVRFSWQTTQTFMDAECAKVDWPEEEKPRIAGYFSKTGQAARPRFFKTAGLKFVTDSDL